MRTPATRWTNDSVRRFAGDGDPLQVITARARALVVKALDRGWTGPPFDPIALADILGLEVVPDDAIPDARTVAVDRKTLRIEFNPSRPRGRMRYSLAHEIAHTMFPDCADRVRHRRPHSELTGDEWQLEALCNIAAAELLMPVETLSGLKGQRPDVDALLAEQKRFDVSAEAIFIRAARISDEPVATFCASRLETGRSAGRYRLDYVIGSRTWEDAVLDKRGGLLPPQTAVSHCSGIGFTARADERWGARSHGRDVHLECVGIPPYPGGRVPRVIGILWDSVPSAGTPRAGSLLSFVRGDATKPRGEGAKLIVQVVNDATSNWGGGGFAVAVRGAFPDVQTDFKDWWTTSARGERRLGQTRIVRAAGDVWIASIVAQHGYGPSTKPRIRYSALLNGLQRVARFAVDTGASLHMPRIGCGQAGGSWGIVEELLRETVIASGAQVTVYDPPGAAVPAAPAQAALDLFDQPTA